MPIKFVIHAKVVLIVIPAKAGIQDFDSGMFLSLDSRLRGNDKLSLSILL